MGNSQCALRAHNDTWRPPTPEVGVKRQPEVLVHKGLAVHALFALIWSGNTLEHQSGGVPLLPCLKYHFGMDLIINNVDCHSHVLDMELLVA